MKIIITESQLKKLINEHYDSERLYSREHIVRELKHGPKELRKYIKTLPEITCEDNDGNKTICTKIPEVVYVYLIGNY